VNRRRVLALASAKGGSAKTTSAAAVGVALAERGRAVLLLDADPQGALGAALGVEETADGPSVARVLAKRADLRGLAPEKRPTVLPAGRDLEAVETDLSRDPTGAVALAEALEGVEAFDWIVIDTPPRLGVLTFAALIAADLALIPVPLDFLAARTLGPTLETVARVRRPKVNPRLRVAAVLPVLGTRTRHAAELLDELPRMVAPMAEALGGAPPVLDPVPRSIEVAEAALDGRTVLDVAPRSEAAAEAARVYRELAKRLDRRE
jgi:chromosome partitioning protein